MDSEAKRMKQIALAHQLLRVTQSEDWKTIILPYFSGEREVMIEAMASMTDALQLMRYAGSVQTLSNAVMGLETQCKRVIDAGIEEKLGKYHA